MDSMTEADVPPLAAPYSNTSPSKKADGSVSYSNSESASEASSLRVFHLLYFGTDPFSHPLTPKSWFPDARQATRPLPVAFLSLWASWLDPFLAGPG